MYNLRSPSVHNLHMQLFSNSAKLTGGAPRLHNSTCSSAAQLYTFGVSGERSGIGWTKWYRVHPHHFILSSWHPIPSHFLQKCSQAAWGDYPCTPWILHLDPEGVVRTISLSSFVFVHLHTISFFIHLTGVKRVEVHCANSEFDCTAQQVHCKRHTTLPLSLRGWFFAILCFHRYANLLCTCGAQVNTKQGRAEKIVHIHRRKEWTANTCTF